MRERKAGVKASTNQRTWFCVPCVSSPASHLKKSFYAPKLCSIVSRYDSGSAHTSGIDVCREARHVSCRLIQYVLAVRMVSLATSSADRVTGHTIVRRWKRSTIYSHTGVTTLARSSRARQESGPSNCHFPNETMPCPPRQPLMEQRSAWVQKTKPPL